MRGTSLERSELLIGGEEELEALFNLLVPAGQSELPLPDLLRVLESLGSEGRESALFKLARQRLREGNERLSRDEFKALMTLRLDNLTHPDCLPALYACYGGTGPGVDAAGLAEVARAAGEYVDAGTLREMIALGDAEGRGRVSLERFRELMASEYRFTAQVRP